MLNLDLLVFDDFYNNPLEVRSAVFSWEFNITGNYPGKRTGPESRPYWLGLKDRMQDLVREEITYWPMEYNTAYQLTLEDDKTWIHHDATDWAGVLYLTPTAPVEAGTAFYRHRDTGIDRLDPNDPRTELHDFNIGTDEHLDKWERVMTVGNKFNRLVLFNGKLYHRSDLAGFGTDIYTGRLFQTFFFNTR